MKAVRLTPRATGGLHAELCASMYTADGPDETAGHAHASIVEQFTQQDLDATTALAHTAKDELFALDLVIASLA